MLQFWTEAARLKGLGYPSRRRHVWVSVGSSATTRAWVTEPLDLSQGSPRHTNLIHHNEVWKR
jgi:hypothetical protein